MKKRQNLTFFMYALSFFIFILVWQIVYSFLKAPLILPSPFEVFTEIKTFCTSAIFWQNFTSTIIRCFISFFISLVLGTILGLLCGLFPFFKDFSAFPLAIIRTTPVVSFILLALFWFQSSQIPIFVSVLMTLPVMVTSVSSGMEKTNKKLLAMSQVYGFSKKQRFFYINIPSALPFFLTGAVSTFGLTWKVVAAGEVLCLPKSAMGTLLYTAQVHLETKMVLALSCLLVLLSFFLEKLFSLSVTFFLKKRGSND